MPQCERGIAAGFDRFLRRRQPLLEPVRIGVRSELSRELSPCFDRDREKTGILQKCDHAGRFATIELAQPAQDRIGGNGSVRHGEGS